MAESKPVILGYAVKAKVGKTVKAVSSTYYTKAAAEQFCEIVKKSTYPDAYVTEVMGRDGL